MIFWDIGSSKPVQQFFYSYLNGTNALVFVVDASDPDRIGTARLMLRKVMEELPSLPLIVIGNKIDENGALGKDEITEKLGLKDSNWKVILENRKN